MVGRRAQVQAQSEEEEDDQLVFLRLAQQRSSGHNNERGMLLSLSHIHWAPFIDVVTHCVNFKHLFGVSFFVFVSNLIVYLFFWLK